MYFETWMNRENNSHIVIGNNLVVIQTHLSFDGDWCSSIKTWGKQSNGHRCQVFISHAEYTMGGRHNVAIVDKRTATIQFVFVIHYRLPWIMSIIGYSTADNSLIRIRHSHTAFCPQIVIWNQTSINIYSDNNKIEIFNCTKHIHERNLSNAKNPQFWLASKSIEMKWFSIIFNNFMFFVECQRTSSHVACVDNMNRSRTIEHFCTWYIVLHTIFDCN